ncbi:MAG: TonB-dependent receptor [Endomicrobiaceae bacterium]
MKKLFYAVVFLFCFGVVYAADVNLSLEKYSQQKNTIVTTDEVSREEVENSISSQALGLLSPMSGIFVQKTGDNGRNDPVIRGIGDSCRKIAILIDGKPERMALFGCGVSQSLLAGNIDRIEVIKGPDSVLYGSGALGGVINIITKEPVNPLEGSIEVSAGSFNTQNSKVYLGGKQNKFLYAVSANKVISDGHLENAQYDATDFYEKFGYILNDGSVLSVEAKQYSGLKHEPTPYPANYWEDYERGSVQANYDKIFSRSSLAVRAYTDYGDHQFSDGWHSKDRLSGAVLNYNNEITDDNILKTGAEFRQQEGKLLSGASYMVHDGWKISDWSLFALDKQNFTEKLSGVLGVRYNDDEVSGGFFSQRAGIEYEITDVFFSKALYSKGFRAPYLNELYLVPARNSDLKAEEVNNYEISFGAKAEDLAFDITGFVMNGDNIIENSGGKLRNTGSYQFKGSEISLNYVFTRNLNAGLGYTYFDAGDNTQGRPGNKIDADVVFKTGKWTFSADSMYIGEYYSANNKNNRLKDFTVINAKIAYEIKEGVKLFADGQNITNESYSMFLDRDGGRIMEMPGAVISFGTQIKF